MTVPLLYRPVAVLWLGLSHLLGTVVSKILLTLVSVGGHHRVQRLQWLRADFDSEVLRPLNYQRQYRNNAEPSSWPQEIAFTEAGERFVEFTKT